jgi:hypothetical protein
VKKRTQRTKPVVLLVRIVEPSGCVWKRHSEHPRLKAAIDHHARFVSGRGVTAWSAFCSQKAAAVLLAEPDADLTRTQKKHPIPKYADMPVPAKKRKPRP